MKIAIIAEQMIFPGGGDRLLLSTLKAFPDADVYTSLYIKENYGFWSQADFKNIKSLIRPSWLVKSLIRSKLLGKFYQKYINIVSPVLYESIDLNRYEVVLSLSARYAKGVVTGLETKHINIYLTPPRYEWDKNTNLRAFHSKGVWGLIGKFLSTEFRRWDFVASRRPDVNYSISKYIMQKVKKYYGLESKVLYPGIADEFNIHEHEKDIEAASTGFHEKFFLVVSRLYDYKRIEWAIRACIKNNRKLVIIGIGPDEKFLRSISKGYSNIQFLSNVSDELMKKYYRNAQALLFCGVEDFGLVMVEALAQGCPVFAYNEGGAAEIVTPTKTGELFNNEDELDEIIKQFDKRKYKQSAIMARAEEFSEDNYINQLKEIVQKYEKK